MIFQQQLQRHSFYQIVKLKVYKISKKKPEKEVFEHNWNFWIWIIFDRRRKRKQEKESGSCRPLNFFVFKLATTSTRISLNVKQVVTDAAIADRFSKWGVNISFWQKLKWDQLILAERLDGDMFYGCHWTSKALGKPKNCKLLLPKQIQISIITHQLDYIYIINYYANIFLNNNSFSVLLCKKLAAESHSPCKI